MKPLLYDLFCGTGGATKGYQTSGFHVVGVDLNPQPRYCGDEFLQMDVFEFFRLYEAGMLALAAAFHTSPPCQEGCQVTPANRRHLYRNLIPEVRDKLTLTGKPYIIENVPGMKKHLISPVMLCGQMFGLKVFRHRYFESNFPLIVPTHERHDGSTGTHRWPYKPVNGYVQVTGQGSNFTLESGRRAMGIPWMIKRELAQAIPPKYTEHLGGQLFDHVADRQEVAA